VILNFDAEDRFILNALQRDNRQTSEALARVTGLSATAVQRRIKRLRDAGVIEADVSLLSPKTVGRPMTMIVSVTLERERADIIDRFKQALRNTPEIMSGFYVTGDADFMLIVSARDMDDYEAFTRRFFYENKDIKSFKTTVVMDRVKVGFQLPVGETP
jgi:Lrp/AsnC family transcriptional regulator, leucine-responsive regulatory protein